MICLEASNYKNSVEINKNGCLKKSENYQSRGLCNYQLIIILIRTLHSLLHNTDLMN